MSFVRDVCSTWCQTEGGAAALLKIDEMLDHLPEAVNLQS